MTWRPNPTGYTCTLLAEGPPFEHWFAPTEPEGKYHPIVNEQDAPLHTGDKDFFPGEDKA